MGNKTNTKSQVMKAGAGYVIGNYLLKGITFLSAPIFTRLLSKEEYGDVGAYCSYESLVYIIVGIALHSSINNAKYKYKEKLEEYVSSIVLLTITSAIAWLALANSFYFIYAERIGFNRFIVNVLIFHSFVSALFQIYSVYISLNYEYKNYLKMSYIYSLGNMILSIVLVLTVFSKDRTTGRILGIFIPMFLIGIYIIGFFFKKSRPHIVGSYWKFGVLYSLPIVPHGISQVILNSFDKIMIRDMVGSGEAGIYNFAYTINSIVNVAKTALENVWKPWVYDKMEHKKYSDIKQGVSNYVIGMGLFTSLVLVVSPEVIKILGDRDYWDSTACVVPVVIGGFFAFLYSIPSIIEYYYEKTKFIAIGTGAAAAINILLNYIFISKYGYIAAAYTTLFTYFLYFIFHYCIAVKLHDSSIFPRMHLAIVSVAVMVSGGVAVVLERHWLIRWVIEVIVGILSVVWANKVFDIINRIKQRAFNK